MHAKIDSRDGAGRRPPLHRTLTPALAVALALALATTAAAEWRAPDGWRSGFVTAPDGTRIHYFETGPAEPAGAAEAPPALLFVPGWTMPGQIYQPQIEHFARRHRVVAMDPRSQGLSDRPDDGHYPAARGRDVKAVIDELGLAPVVPVCWSLAVSECVAVVDEFGTGDLAALVLVDGLAGGAYDPNTTPAILGWIGTLQRDRKSGTASFVRSMYRTPQDEAYLRQVTEWSLSMPTDAMMAAMVGGLTNDNRDALAKLDVPTLLAVTQSPYLPLYEDMRDRIPGVRYEVFEVGHALFVDQPERFNRLVEELLSGGGPAAEEDTPSAAEGGR
jgi:non-heme chloroperoxidase